jgi:sulfur-oxidizing protein SoxA
MKRVNGFTLAVIAMSVFYLQAAAADTARSGYDYITDETRAMQDDDIENPGMLTVDLGHEYFNEVSETNGRSCATCHGEDGEKLDVKAIAAYPKFLSELKQIKTLQGQINDCRPAVAKEKLPTNHPELIALETFVRHLAAGEKVNIDTSGEVAELLKQGEELYMTRYGLIDMSCYHCHTLYPGSMIRGQKISQGQANGFPAYRLDSGEMANLSQRIQQCLNLMRAEPFSEDSDEMNLMSLYIMSRSNGLPIETPAVRY